MFTSAGRQPTSSSACGGTDLLLEPAPQPWLSEAPVSCHEAGQRLSPLAGKGLTALLSCLTF